MNYISSKYTTSDIPKNFYLESVAIPIHYKDDTQFSTSLNIWPRTTKTTISISQPIFQSNFHRFCLVIDFQGLVCRAACLSLTDGEKNNYCSPEIGSGRNHIFPRLAQEEIPTEKHKERNRLPKKIGLWSLSSAKRHQGSLSLLIESRLKNKRQSG